MRFVRRRRRRRFFTTSPTRSFFFRFSLYDPGSAFYAHGPAALVDVDEDHPLDFHRAYRARRNRFSANYNHLAAALGNLFSFQNVLLMWLTTFVIKSIHELGHGLTCKHFGGEVHEIGVMALVFTPYFFVNVSDSWVMPNRMHRMLVSAAGIYVELIFAAFATFFWAIVQPGLLKDFLFNIIFIASVSTLIFNANPLMRFDGYYIMTDLIEVPNLQSKSRALIQHQVNRLLFGSSKRKECSRGCHCRRNVSGCFTPTPSSRGSTVTTSFTDWQSSWSRTSNPLVSKGWPIGSPRSHLPPGLLCHLSRFSKVLN
jgi:hypothetical protein